MYVYMDIYRPYICIRNVFIKNPASVTKHNGRRTNTKYIEYIHSTSYEVRLK